MAVIRLDEEDYPRSSIRERPRALPSIYWPAFSKEGPRLEIPEVDLNFIIMTFSLDLRNIGELPEIARMEVGMFADVLQFPIPPIKQFAIRPDGTVDRGDVREGAIQVDFTNSPLVVAPGATSTLTMTISVPTREIVARQESVELLFGKFQWWVAKYKASYTNGDEIGGENDIDLKDWFIITSKISSVAASNPGYEVAQVVTPT